MIIMRDVTKKYNNGVTALKGITINIDRGEFVYIVGPSGAGKSTFVKLMYREVKPTEGQLIIEGQELGELKEKEVPFLRRQFGVSFQDFKLLSQLTIYEKIGRGYC